MPSARYTERVLEELGQRGGLFEAHQIKSIYLGGGTPSLWPTEEMAKVIAAIRVVFPAEQPLEITLEANPKDCTPRAFTEWQAAGVNRLSIGVQSVFASELTLLGRDHAMGDGARAVVSAQKAGFRTVSADVILGMPGGEGGQITASRLKELGVAHISAYELTVEKGTALYGRARRGDFVPRSDDALAEILTGVSADLQRAGYEHYEVSSFARPGQRAVHNSLYWQGAPYLGLGNGAVSLETSGDGGRRVQNQRAVGAYLRGEAALVLEELTPEQMTVDRLWLGLRTAEGVPNTAFRGRSRDLEWLSRGGLAVDDGSRIRPTLRGFLCANQVMRRFLAV